eukprot:11973619-Ditylum_brightwellii.AAC.1
MDLDLANMPPRITHYRSGLYINSIPGDNNAPQECIKQYQSWVGSLMWLSISTCPDLSSAVSFLSSFNHKPSVQHIAAAKHVGCYLKSTLAQGIPFSSDDHNTITYFLNLPFKEDSILPLCDANWGSQSASKDPTCSTKVSMEALRSIS